MDERTIDNITINYFSWDDSNPLGGTEIPVGSATQSGGVVHLTDEQARAFSVFISKELNSGKHISLRTFHD